MQTTICTHIGQEGIRRTIDSLGLTSSPQNGNTKPNSSVTSLFFPMHHSRRPSLHLSFIVQHTPPSAISSYIASQAYLHLTMTPVANPPHRTSRQYSSYMYAHTSRYIYRQHVSKPHDVFLPRDVLPSAFGSSYFQRSAMIAMYVAAPRHDLPVPSWCWFWI